MVDPEPPSPAKQSRIEDLSDIDLTDLGRFEHGFPHHDFVRLRRAAPVWWHEPTVHTPAGEGFWVVSTHQVVLEVFHRADDFSSEAGGTRTAGGTMIEDLPGASSIFNMMDDPRHQRIRRLVNNGFTPRMIGALEADLRGRMARILDRLGEEGPRDFVEDVAKDLPLQAIAMLLGVPQADREELCDWVDATMGSIGAGPGMAGSGGPSGAGAPRASRDATPPESRTTSARPAGGRLARQSGSSPGSQLRDYAAELIAERRRCPRDDMISVVARASLPDQVPARLTHDELLGFFTLLFTAGSETTRKAVAGGLLALVERPGEMKRLCEDRSLLPAATEEIVRWTTPSVYKRRTATREVELCGKVIEPGDKVTVWEMSANRDESVFEEPFTFDVGRDPNPHVGFGHGTHHCLGASLARLEIRVMLDELLSRYSTVELAGEPQWTRSNRLFGLQRLPVRLSP